LERMHVNVDSGPEYQNMAGRKRQSSGLFAPVPA
jgi:hypothetical protein